MSRFGYFSCALIASAAFLPFFTFAATCPNLTRNLSFGSRGSDVVQLQQFLIVQNLLASGNTTGYFGRLTQAAVKKWQCKNMNICSGSPSTTGWGNVGPRTRATITVSCHKVITLPVTPTPSPSPTPTPAPTPTPSPTPISIPQPTPPTAPMSTPTPTPPSAPATSIVLDSRLSIAHVSGKYPERGAGYLLNGAQDAYALGFRSLEIYLSPEICWVTDQSRPLGIYQTLDWCVTTNPYAGYSSLTAPSLRDLAQHQRYKDVFALPFKTVIMTTEATQYGSGAYFLRIAQARFTRSELDQIYKEYFDLVAYLSTQYKNTGKTFVIQTPNEMDWSMIGIADATKSSSLTAVQNATDYWNQIQNAVNDARRLVPTVGMNIYHGCEVNLAVKAMTGTTTAINSVLPGTYCDLYGYSAWDSVLANPSDAGSSQLAATLDYIASKAPDSAAFGNKNVYLSELGIPETHNGASSGAAVAAYAKAAFAWGSPYVNVWALHDNECNAYLPASGSGCPGFWIRKPDMSLSAMYTALLNAFKK